MARISQETWDEFDRLRGLGWPVKRAAERVGVGRTSAHEHEKRVGPREASKPAVSRGKGVPDPVPVAKLSKEARRARDDFSFFRKWFMGRRDIPWQAELAATAAELLVTEHDEYCVTNMPPGSGKSTFLHDLVCWLIVRDRRLRVQMGSKTTKQAKAYTGLVRRTLERTVPLEGAHATLAMEYGRFKPEGADLWRIDEFIVEQFGSASVDEKEATVQALSQEMGFLGARADFIVWDDLVDGANSGTLDAREKLQEFWSQTAETRLEPRGVLFLNGQRIAPDDLFHYCLEQELGDEGDDDWPDDEPVDRPKKYRHIVFPAHFEDKCEGVHRKGEAEPYPDGCLLDPERVGWRKLSGLKRNNRALFEISYQQKEEAPGQNLVPQVWIDGGTDPETREEVVGCKDRDRDLNELPDDMVRTGADLSIVSVDPSPTRWWAIQHWAYDHSTERRVLVNVTRRKMGADQFLDRTRSGGYVGLLTEWQEKARDLGIPLTHLIVEKNAAQQFMMQYDFVREYLRKEGIILVPHATNRNKADPEYGVRTIGFQYKLGRVRIPYKAGSSALHESRWLIEEVTRWPGSSTEDQVMAHWFMEYNLPSLTFHSKTPLRSSRPSWLRGKKHDGQAAHVVSRLFSQPRA